WRDKIVNFHGKKSAFRGVLQVTYADGSVKVYGTKAGEWKAGVGGPVTHAAIFDGEEYDARVRSPWFGGESFKPAEKNEEFKGEILPSEGAEVRRRWDLMLNPVEAYVWQGVDGADESNKVFGTVHKLRDVSFRSTVLPKPVVLAKGETLVVDSGQNCAGVPVFCFSAKKGTVLTCLPAEMLNDGHGERARGNDGPAGSVYRENLRCPATGMRAVYTFGASGQEVLYYPRFTFFGYRYVSVTATDEVKIGFVSSLPVTSIAQEMELGSLETGVAEVNKLISNVYWGQLSNYLSVPTDCPQRNERLGWMADTQVFTEAGAFNADTRSFFHKFTRDIRDIQDPRGGFTGVAPSAQYGCDPMRVGWSDAGVIVPYQVWKQFGDAKIVEENWDAMERYLARLAETKGEREATKGENGGYQWADWLSYEDYESSGGRGWKNGQLRPETALYWNYLYGCYWLWDAQMMEAMAAATGKDAAKYARMAAEAKDYVKKTFFEADGLVAKALRGLQTPALFALKLGLVEGEAKKQTVDTLRRNFAEHGDCLQTGFLGTSILMETLTENGMADIAYTLLLQRKNPSWLYSVDQGATTIWERWNSYTKERGFGPVWMNSFNHYAYGAVLAWMYKDMAGIAADPKAPGFRNIVMAPKADRRVGFVKAAYKSAAGLVKSAWRYEGEKWIWEFTIPDGATADVTVPGEAAATRYKAGTYRIER
ncbi:MAG: family 78 glycoside hydrolase catalytic domain, partial [Kiritimatiellae bacterium]|nr:family 78 glycoside hydrolase catalytic domain [Kiritimatiellia bacterium]